MRLRRLLLLFTGVSLLLVTPQPAFADHCEPREAPPPIDEDVWWCHTPPPTPTPEPTPTPPPPTEAPPPADTPAPQPQAPIRRATPAPTLNPIQVPEETVSVDVPGAVFDDIPEGTLKDETEPAASATVWIFGFIVGFLIGAIVGRASWGLGRRRRRQVFG